MSIRMVVAPGFQGEAAFILGDESELADARADVLENIGLDMPKLASGAVVNGLSLRNYPNPFRGVTSITYALPQDGNVNLSVYNILGEEVANLVNSHQASGQYTVDFNAGNLMPGIYQYRLQLNGKSETTITRTMIVTE
ncbi:MAG: T9SS type A sorting domain-containing protein [Bacteroidales bacterium]|nr:T9SS type A sorting domain-containing protein [Bacteroidales bacterium]